MNNSEKEIIKVLLVDDDEDDYILTKYLFDDLKGNIYKLEWTTDGEKALAAMKSHEHDIYFVDYRLGEFNGLEIIREAVASGCTSPIVLLTGQGDAEVDFQAMQAGAADYLVIRYSIRQARTFDKMQASETKFRSVIQSASDAIFLVNRKGEVTLWNEAAENIFGYTEEEILGRQATILMGEKYARKAEALGLENTIRNLLAPLSGKVIQAAGRRKDDSEFPLELSGSIWKTNGGYSYTAIIRDVTERQRANESLRESEERYRELFENANDIIYVHDLDGNFISVNETGLKVFGYSREEALKLNLLQIVAPSDLEHAGLRVGRRFGAGNVSEKTVAAWFSRSTAASFTAKEFRAPFRESPATSPTAKKPKPNATVFTPFQTICSRRLVSTASFCISIRRGKKFSVIKPERFWAKRFTKFLIPITKIANHTSSQDRATAKLRRSNHS